MQRADEAASRLSEARAIFESLGAVRWLTRLDGVAQRDEITA